MATRRALKSINWSALAERISEAEKNNFAAFKTKSDLYFRRVNEYPENPPKIDWSFYKNKIAIPGLVDKFQKEYESLKISYPEDKYSSEVDAQAKIAQQQVDKFIQESNARIDNTLKEIAKLEGMIKYSQMTMEDFAEAHPDIAIDTANRPTIYPHTPEFQPEPNEDTITPRPHDH